MDCLSLNELRGQNAHAVFKRAQLIVHFHPQRLKCLRRRMPAAVATDNFFDRASELQRFGKRRIFAHLHNQTGDAARRRFFAEIAEQAGQIFFAIAVYNFRGC